MIPIIEQVLVLYDFDEHRFSVSKKSEETVGVVNLTEKINIQKHYCPKKSHS